MEKKEGLKQINRARWQAKENYWVLEVNDSKGLPCIFYLEKRPSWCDRGHYTLKIDCYLNIDPADGFPRYFFSFREAAQHARSFLRWRIWKERTPFNDGQNEVIH